MGICLTPVTYTHAFIEANLCAGRAAREGAHHLQERDLHLPHVRARATLVAKNTLQGSASAEDTSFCDTSNNKDMTALRIKHWIAIWIALLGWVGSAAADCCYPVKEVKCTDIGVKYYDCSPIFGCGMNFQACDKYINRYDGGSAACAASCGDSDKSSTLSLCADGQPASWRGWHVRNCGNFGKDGISTCGPLGCNCESCRGSKRKRSLMAVPTARSPAPDLSATTPFERLVNELKDENGAISDPADILKIFNTVDADGGGSLSAEELCKITNCTAAELDAIRRDQSLMDTDGDGGVEIAEFDDDVATYDPEVSLSVATTSGHPLVVFKSWLSFLALFALGHHIV